MVCPLQNIVLVYLLAITEHCIGLFIGNVSLCSLFSYSLLNMIFISESHDLLAPD